jgi:HEAT repeat protein
MRYYAATFLASHFGSKAPDETVDVLLAMLTSNKLEVQLSTGGDARFQAAEALGWLGRKANRPDVIKALQEAAQDSDVTLSSKAKVAMKRILP